MSEQAIRIDVLSSTGPLFGLDESVFQRIIQQDQLPVSIEQIEQVDHINKSFYGGRGEKAVVKVCYRHRGVSGEALFFIKRHSQPNPNEALHYTYLSRFDAPIPLLHAFYSQENQHDLIITEVLKPFHIDDDPAFMMDKAVLKPFVQVTALFNSVHVSEEYLGIITGDYDLLTDKLKPYQKKLRSMFELTETDPLYSSLRPALTGQVQASVLHLMLQACEKIGQQAKGLYHWDHKPRNVGWSDVQQRYVIFDLEDTLWGPRFYNIGMWLGGEDKHEAKYAPREELARLYLDIYNARNRGHVSVDELLHECYPLWIAYKIETLLHYFHEVGPRPYSLGERDPKQYRQEMESKFLQLINLLYSLR